MKKKSYTRPELYFESFELSQSIAAGCSFMLNFSKVEVCNPTDDQKTQYGFLTKTFITNAACTDNLPGGPEQFCYTPGQGAIWQLANS